MSGLYRAALAWQSRAVARRHLLVHLRHWYTAALPPICEPIILLLAFGVGLGQQIAAIAWRGQELSYVSYLAPGILAYTAFMTAFFQSLFGAYIRMHYQRIWEGQLCSQVRLDHVIWGEILWASLLAMVYSTLVIGVLVVFAALGMLEFHWYTLPLIYPQLLLVALAFSAIGLWFTSLVPSIDHMNLPFFLVIMPIAFTSSTYFPITSEAWPVQLWQGINPLHHGAEGIRLLLLNGSLSYHLAATPLLCAAIITAVVPRVARRLRRRVLGEF